MTSYIRALVVLCGGGRFVFLFRWVCLACLVVFYRRARAHACVRESERGGMGAKRF